MHIVKQLLNILAPAHCASCRALLDLRVPWCDSCAAMIRPVFALDIKLTQTKHMSVYAYGAYEEPLATLIRAKHGRCDIAAYQLGELVAQYYSTLQISSDYLIPIPLHWRRYAWRGFNQAALMAQVIGKAHNIPVADILQRVRHTAYQATSVAQDRAKNVAEVFALREVDHELYRGKDLVLVDDVMTTGSTLHAAGRALLPLKPASIRALVAGRTIT